METEPFKNLSVPEIIGTYVADVVNDKWQELPPTTKDGLVIFGILMSEATLGGLGLLAFKAMTSNQP